LAHQGFLTKFKIFHIHGPPYSSRTFGTKSFFTMIFVFPARENRPLPSLTFAILFPAKKPAGGPETRALRAESIGPLNFGFRIYLTFFFNPHSAIGIPQFE
jgi:hypothetical protein